MTAWERPRRIQPADQQCAFDSGIHALDDYFERHALKNDVMGRSNCFVLLKPEEQVSWPAVCGFFTLSAFSVDASDGERITGQRGPQYPTAVVLLGRLAVQRVVHRNGAGECMLVDALTRARSSDVGSVGVITDAKNIAAEKFYEKHGFKPLDESKQAYPRRLFLPRSAIP